MRGPCYRTCGIREAGESWLWRAGKQWSQAPWWGHTALRKRRWWRSIALENKDRGISANTVLPGTMDTPANRAADPKADPLQWVQPAQVAALLVHLASDAGAQVTGAAIPIYGRQV